MFLLFQMCFGSFVFEIIFNCKFNHSYMHYNKIKCSGSGVDFHLEPYFVVRFSTAVADVDIFDPEIESWTVRSWDSYRIFFMFSRISSSAFSLVLPSMPKIWINGRPSHQQKKQRNHLSLAEYREHVVNVCRHYHHQATPSLLRSRAYHATTSVPASMVGCQLSH